MSIKELLTWIVNVVAGKPVETKDDYVEETVVVDEAPVVEETVEADEEVVLENMTKKELIEYGKLIGVTLKPSMNKKLMLQKLSEKA